MSLLEQYTHQCTQSMHYPVYYYRPTSWILTCQFICQQLRTTTTNTTNGMGSSLSGHWGLLYVLVLNTIKK